MPEGASSRLAVRPVAGDCVVEVGNTNAFSNPVKGEFAFFFVAGCAVSFESSARERTLGDRV